MKKRKRTMKKILFMLLAAIIAVGLYAAYENFVKKPVIPSVEDLIKEKKEKDYKDKDDNKIDVNTYVNIIPGAREAYQNSDIMGKLEIPNLNIDTWVARSSNNEYYLNYNLNRQYDQIGAPFFDYRNYSLNTDRQLNIYGHNTTNPNIVDRLPFINLEAYADKGIFDNYKDIYLSIDERQIHYEVIAIKIINGTDNEHMKIIFKDDNDFLKHAAKLLQNTLYRRENVEITASTKLIVLQVCHFNPPHTYLLVIGKEVV